MSCRLSPCWKTYRWRLLSKMSHKQRFFLKLYHHRNYICLQVFDKNFFPLFIHLLSTSKYKSLWMSCCYGNDNVLRRARYDKPVIWIWANWIDSTTAMISWNAKKKKSQFIRVLFFFCKVKEQSCQPFFLTSCWLCDNFVFARPDIGMYLFVERDPAAVWWMIFGMRVGWD